MDNTTILLIIFGIVVITGSVTVFFRSQVEKWKKIILIFSSAIIAGLLFVHIIPEIYLLGGSSVGIALLIGLFIQILLEKLSNGIEHGHFPIGNAPKKTILLSLMLGLCLHAFIEGTPLLQNTDTSASSEHIHESHDHGHDHHHHVEELDNDKDVTVKFIWAIASHKIPVTIVLTLFLLSAGLTIGHTLTLVFVFSLATPIGALTGQLFMEMKYFASSSNYLMGIATGMLLHIISTILFEHSHSEESDLKNVLALLTGLIIGIILFFI